MTGNGRGRGRPPKPVGEKLAVRFETHLTRADAIRFRAQCDKDGESPPERMRRLMLESMEK